MFKETRLLDNFQPLKQFLILMEVFKIIFIIKESTYVNNTNNVKLRGTMLRGKYSDLPNLIFFPETLDSV